MTDGPTPAKRRSDAERNRATILAVARAALVDEAIDDLSMAEVARRAGVGMATLYRNFPGRRELLEALYTEKVDELCAAAGTLAERSPGSALTAWLRQFATFIVGKRHLAEELLELTDASAPIFGGSRDRVLDAGRPLLAAAQAAGEARADLTVEQVLDLVLAVATIERGSGYVEPMMAAALDGVRGRNQDTASPPFPGAAV